MLWLVAMQAVDSSMTALLVAAPFPEGVSEQGGGRARNRGPRGQARTRTSLVLRGSEQLGPNGLSGAGHKRRRHGTNDIGKATNGSSGEAEKTKKGETGDDKCRQHDRAEEKGQQQ
jgi:hypothetical protein